MRYSTAVDRSGRSWAYALMQTVHPNLFRPHNLHYVWLAKGLDSPLVLETKGLSNSVVE